MLLIFAVALILPAWGFGGFSPQLEDSFQCGVCRIGEEFTMDQFEAMFGCEKSLLADALQELILEMENEKNASFEQNVEWLTRLDTINLHSELFLFRAKVAMRRSLIRSTQSPPTQSSKFGLTSVWTNECLVCLVELLVWSRHKVSK